MKVAFFNNLYYPFQRGGAETVVAQDIEKQLAAGHQVILISTRPSGQAAPEQNPSYKTYYLPSGYYRLAQKNILSRLLWQITNLFAYPRTIQKILEQEKPDLALTHNLMGLGFRMPQVFKRLGIRQEHFLHDIQLLHPSGLIFVHQEKKIDRLIAKAYQSYTRRYFQSVAKVISPSRWLLQEHLQRNFFPSAEKEIRPLTVADCGIVANRLTKKILFIGQIEKHKGVLLLIEAFREIDNPAISLNIVGDGSQLATAKQLADQDNRISFWGYLDGEKLNRLIEQSRALVVPSLCYENYPTVIKKAQAAGLMVIWAASLKLSAPRTDYLGAVTRRA